MGAGEYLRDGENLEAGMKAVHTPFIRDGIYRDCFFLACVCGFLFFYGLSSFGLVGADEPRYAQVAREMLARHDWITPILGGRPWLEKPILYYWQAMLAYKLFGVSDWASRLPSSVDASLMVVAIYLFLRRFRPGFHLDAALMTASAAGVIGFARAAGTDMPLAAMFTISMLAWFAWFESRDRKYLAGFYFFLALATLAKGPVAPVLAIAIIVLFAVVKKDSSILRASLWFAGIALFLLVASPWYAAVEIKNPDFFRVFILEHNLARFGTNLYRHQQPFWYYVPVFFIALLPWTFAAVFGVVEYLRTWRKNDETQTTNDFGMFCSIWFCVPIVFFSISQSKLPGYILPALPAGILLAAEYFRRRLLNHIKMGTVPILLHSAVAALPLFPALMIRYLVIQKHLPWNNVMLFPAAVTILVAIGIAIAFRFAGLRILRFATLAPTILAVGVILHFGAPSIDSTLSARPLAHAINDVIPKLQVQPSTPVAVFSVHRETEFGLAFYLNQKINSYSRHEVPSEEHVVVAACRLSKRNSKSSSRTKGFMAWKLSLTISGIFLGVPHFVPPIASSIRALLMTTVILRFATRPF